MRGKDSFNSCHFLYFSVQFLNLNFFNAQLTKACALIVQSIVFSPDQFYLNNSIGSSY